MKLTTLRTWALILFLVAEMPVGALYRIPVSSAQGTEYVLHVVGGVTCIVGGSFVSYSGDYSGFLLPPFDIGPVSSPFTVTLTVDAGVGCHPGIFYDFTGWSLDGVDMGSSPSLQVTVDDLHNDRTAVPGYARLPSSLLVSLETFLDDQLTVPSNPRNGEETSRSIVTLGVNVNAMPLESAVSGAAVSIYVDGNQACSGTSFPVDSIYENNYACNYRLTEPAHIYSWYATATKSGYYDGASETWTFKYIGYYTRAPVGGFLVPTNKSVILGTYLDMLGLIVVIAVVVTVTIAPGTARKEKS